MSDATQLVERVFQAAVGMIDVATMHVGDRLGLYASLRDDGPGTASQLAERTGLDERYLQEWLEQQATTGVLELDGLRRFVLPAGHAEALVDRDSPLYVAALGRQVIGMLTALPHVLEAFRSGGGVPFAAYGDDTREGIAAQNRAMFVNDLASWLAAVPGLDERLRSPGARIADLGCGEGWSTIAIAVAYAGATVEGYDLDAASIQAARRHADEADVADRVTFECQEATTATDRPGYQLVTIFEALHHMPRPVQALHSVRRTLASDGSLVVAEERVADRFAPPGDEVERLVHGISVLHCLPASRHDPDSVAVGSMLREPLLRSFADDAGYSAVEVLPIDNDFWRFYWLVP